MKLRTNNQGSAVVLTTLCLPIMMILGSMILHQGLLQNRQFKLDFKTQQAAQTGLAQLNNIGIEAANKIYQNQCQSEEVPAFCNSSNPFDFLSQTQLNHLLKDPDTIAQITQSIQTLGLPHFEFELTLHSKFLILEVIALSPSKSNFKHHPTLDLTSKSSSQLPLY